MSSGSNRIRRSKPTRPLSDASRLTIRIRDDDLQAVPLASLGRLARSLGIDTARDDDETDGAYRHRLRRAVLRAEAALARGLSPSAPNVCAHPDEELSQTPKIG